MRGPRHELYRDAYVARGDWIAGTAPDALADHARAAPDRVAVIDAYGALTYRGLDRLVRSFALALLARGIGPGDRVAIQLPNRREFAIVQQAALRIGAAYVPLLPQLREGDIAHALAASGARVLVIPAVYRGYDHAAAAATLAVDHVFVVGGSFEAALAEEREVAFGATLDAIAVNPDALRVVLFTSGTESRPKGVLHSYNTQYFGLKRHVDYFDLGAGDVVMCVSPVGHGTGAVNGVEFALHLGATVVMQEMWEPHAGLAAIVAHSATMMWGATTFYADLVAAAAEPGAPRSAAFRYAFTAGAPVPVQLAERVRATLGATLVTAYGQSEGQNIAITCRDDPVSAVAGSDGRIHDGIVWKLTDADRTAVPEGAEGEIAYRGPNVCLGYLDPAHTERAFDDDGFLYSGDLARVDAGGYLRITGRSKDIIIRGGENISPAEIEELLFDHPAVARVAVVGYPDPRLGERACAFVVAAPGATPTLKDIVAHMALRRVAKFKYPERLVLVDALPTTPSGKVRKAELRQSLVSAG